MLTRKKTKLLRPTKIYSFLPKAEGKKKLEVFKVISKVIFNIDTLLQWARPTTEGPSCGLGPVHCAWTPTRPESLLMAPSTPDKWKEGMMQNIPSSYPAKPRGVAPPFSAVLRTRQSLKETLEALWRDFNACGWYLHDTQTTGKVS